MLRSQFSRQTHFDCSSELYTLQYHALFSRGDRFQDCRPTTRTIIYATTKTNLRSQYTHARNPHTHTRAESTYTHTRGIHKHTYTHTRGIHKHTYTHTRGIHKHTYTHTQEESSAVNRELDALLKVVQPPLFNASLQTMGVVYSGCSEGVRVLADVLSSRVYQIPLVCNPSLFFSTFLNSFQLCFLLHPLMFLLTLAVGSHPQFICTLVSLLKRPLSPINSNILVILDIALFLVNSSLSVSLTHRLTPHR